MSNDLLTTAEVAVIIGKSIRTVVRLAERDDDRALPYVRKLAGNNGYLFDRSVVEMYARQIGMAKAS